MTDEELTRALTMLDEDAKAEAIADLFSVFALQPSGNNQLAQTDILAERTEDTHGSLTLGYEALSILQKSLECALTIPIPSLGGSLSDAEGLDLSPENERSGTSPDCEMLFQDKDHFCDPCDNLIFILL